MGGRVIWGRVVGGEGKWGRVVGRVSGVGRVSAGRVVGEGGREEG